MNHQDASASLDISVEMPRAAASESQLANQTIEDDSMVMPDMPDMPDMPEVILSALIVFFPESALFITFSVVLEFALLFSFLT